MTPEEAIKIVNTKANLRTRYEGQDAFLDEVLVAEIERLRAQLAVADESARLQASVADEKIDALTRERDEARDAAKTLLRSPHARVCDPTACWPWLGD